jgi:hypothetical protein
MSADYKTHCSLWFRIELIDILKMLINWKVLLFKMQLCMIMLNNVFFNV